MLRTFKNDHSDHKCIYTREKGREQILYTGVFINQKVINILKSKINDEGFFSNLPRNTLVQPLPDRDL